MARNERQARLVAIQTLEHMTKVLDLLCAVARAKFIREGFDVLADLPPGCAGIALPGAACAS